MSIGLRIMLIVGAIAVLIFMISKIRQAKMKIEYSIFWIIFSILLVIFGLFPQIASTISNCIGFVSPSNFVFLVIIGVLILKIFLMTVQISHLESKMDSLIQKYGIYTKK